MANGNTKRAIAISIMFMLSEKKKKVREQKNMQKKCFDFVSTIPHILHLTNPSPGALVGIMSHSKCSQHPLIGAELFVGWRD